MSDSPKEEPAQTAAAPAPESGASMAAPPRESAWRRTGPVVLVALLVAALFAWQQYNYRNDIGALRHEIASKLAESDTQSKESRMIAGQVRDALAEAQVKLGVLESRLGESQSQQIALEALYQELSRNRDEWAYAEIEQSLLIVSQQLALAGNVKAALIALQSADTRLQTMDRPQLAALRKAINRDIERLKAAPHVDTVAISVRLDTLIGQVDRMPLSMEVRPQPEPASAGPAQAEEKWWSRLWREIGSELKQLVRVQHMEGPDVPLLAPAQAYFLRENLKLRLLGARLALLSRDPESYKADLKAARDWLNRYYDTRSEPVAQALGTLRNLHEAPASIEAPDIDATLEAVRTARVTRERSAQ
ncbi:MAG TPA: uroporphyrinogen-III C-methyltransferase [Burkholderiales bacterium]|nr:uroporphyrinogen-III C-methyltransferase [Burkholderiales bacterium]